MRRKIVFIILSMLVLGSLVFVFNGFSEKDDEIKLTEATKNVDDT